MPDVSRICIQSRSRLSSTTARTTRTRTRIIPAAADGSQPAATRRMAILSPRSQPMATCPKASGIRIQERKIPAVTMHTITTHRAMPAVWRGSMCSVFVPLMGTARVHIPGVPVGAVRPGTGKSSSAGLQAVTDSKCADPAWGAGPYHNGGIRYRYLRHFGIIYRHEDRNRTENMLPALKTVRDRNQFYFFSNSRQTELMQ